MRKIRAIFLMVWLMGICMPLAFVVFRFVEGLGLVGDSNGNEVLGWVAWFFAFVPLMLAPPALKVLFAQGPRVLRSMLSGPVKWAFLLALASALAAGLLVGYVEGFERGAGAMTLVYATLGALHFFVFIFCGVFRTGIVPFAVRDRKRRRVLRWRGRRGRRWRRRGWRWGRLAATSFASCFGKVGRPL